MNAYPLPTSAALSNNLVTVPDAHPGLEPVRRAPRPHPERARQLPRPLLLVEDGDHEPVHLPRRAAAGVSKAVGLGNEDTFAGTSGLVAQHAVLGWVHVFSPRLVLDTRVGYNQLRPRLRAGRRRGRRRSSASSSGCPTRTSRTSRTASRSSAPAATRASARAARCRSCATRTRYQLVANLTYAADKHTIKAGFDVRRRHMGEFQTNRGNGRFNFSPNITNNPANNTGGHVMASFLLGAPSLIEQDYLLADVAIRGTEYGFYVADDWRASVQADPEPRAALRARHAVHREGRTSGRSFDPDTATVLVAGRNGVSETAGVKTFYKAFAPRLGLRLPARRPAPSCAAGRASSGTRRATAATSCACTATCPSAPSTASTPATSSCRRRVSDGFPTIPAAQPRHRRQPERQRHRRRSGLPARLRAAVQPHRRARAGLARCCSRRPTSATRAATSTPPTTSTRRCPDRARSTTAGRSSPCVPRLADVTWAVSDGTADYHALQFSAEKRLSHGLGGLLAYTWSPFHRHRGPELRRRRRRSPAPGPAQPPGRPRQLAVRHPPSAHHRRELPAALRQGPALAERRRRRRLPARRMAGRTPSPPSRPGSPFTPTLNAAVANTGTGSRPDRIGDGGTLVGSHRGPLVRHRGLRHARQLHLRQRRPQHPLRAGAGELRLLALQGLPRERPREGPVPRRGLQPLQPPAVRPAERGHRRRQRRDHHRIVGTPRQIQFGAKVVF